MAWWQGTSIYQVYPRSFADANSDGIGDLAGIVERLDYIAGLGVETLWVSPFFASPQRDFGYDITDYEAIAPEYGVLADAQRLIDETHRRGMKIMFDLVLNHTSDQHPWFLWSKASRNNAKSDWYIWSDGRGKRGRRRPNNWRSDLEVKSAWQWCPERQQWYLATFLPFQPDLNWRNPEVRDAMFDVVRFWLRRGVDGFRLDIFGQIMKDPGLRDNPIQPNTETSFPRLWRRKYNENTADNIQLAKDLRAVCQEFSDPDRILLGEVFGPAEVLRSYLGAPEGSATTGGSDSSAAQGDSSGDGLNLVFLFEFLQYSYDADWFRSTIARFEEAFPAPMQPTYVLENHDRSRSIDRVGGDIAKAKVMAVLLLTLRGVPAIYYGQELGMANTPIPIRDALDPVVKTFFRWVPDAVASRLPERINRDEMRTPMQWSGGPNAGFCPAGVRPWLPANPNRVAVNVELETADPDSILSLYRRLLALRREQPAIHRGTLRLLGDPREPLPEGVVGFDREAVGEEAPGVQVLANLGVAEVTVKARFEEVLASCGDVELLADAVRLAPDSAVVLAKPPAE